MGRRPRFPDQGPPPAPDRSIVGRSEVAVLRVALVNAPPLSAVCDHGVGHQMPPGLRMVDGARRGRAAVTRIDAARDHLPVADAARSSNYFGGLSRRPLLNCRV
jgi:hypothetical protein